MVQLQYRDKDFTCWTIEKTKNMITSLCWLTTADAKAADNMYVKDTLCEALKVYTMLKEALNCVEYGKAVDLLLRYGADGLCFLDDLLDNTNNSNLMKHALKNVSNETVLDLIRQNDRTNRTHIASIIAGIDNPNTWLKAIQADLEKVHNGEKTWEWFYSRHSQDDVDCDLCFEDSLVEDIYNQFYTEERNRL